MYGNSLDGVFYAIAIVGALIGAALVGVVWVFVVYVWPVLKAWLHAITG